MEQFINFYFEPELIKKLFWDPEIIKSSGIFFPHLFLLIYFLSHVLSGAPYFLA